MSGDCNKLIKIIAILGVIAFGVGAFFVNNILYYAFGIGLGTVISIARMILLERALNKSVDMSPVDAQNYVRLQYSMRMFGVIAVALIAIKVQQIDIVGFVIGILLVQPSVYIMGLFEKKK